jgi:hypothetical protein
MASIAARFDAEPDDAIADVARRARRLARLMARRLRLDASAQDDVAQEVALRTLVRFRRRAPPPDVDADA